LSRNVRPLSGLPLYTQQGEYDPSTHCSSFPFRCGTTCHPFTPILKEILKGLVFFRPCARSNLVFFPPLLERSLPLLKLITSSWHLFFSSTGFLLHLGSPPPPGRVPRPKQDYDIPFHFFSFVVTVWTLSFGVPPTFLYLLLTFSFPPLSVRL